MNWFEENNGRNASGFPREISVRKWSDHRCGAYLTQSKLLAGQDLSAWKETN
jgi:hypothetical protein